MIATATPNAQHDNSNCNQEAAGIAMEYYRSVLSKVALGVEPTTYIINKFAFFGQIRLDFPDPFGALDGQEVPLPSVLRHTESVMALKAIGFNFSLALDSCMP